MGVGGVKFNVARQFPASFQKHFETNRIFSVALVYFDKMSTIASLGVKAEIKNILDSGGFFREVQQYMYLQRKFPHKRYGISRRSVRIAKPTAFDVIHQRS